MTFKISKNIDKFGTAGLFLTAFFHPVAFRFLHLQLLPLDLAVPNYLVDGPCGSFRAWYWFQYGGFTFLTGSMVACIHY